MVLPPPIHRLGPTAITSSNVINHPTNLCNWISLPVVAHLSHLVAWEGLWDTIGARRWVSGVYTAARFVINQGQGGL